MYNQNLQLSDAHAVSRMVKRGVVVRNISIFVGLVAVVAGIAAVVTSVVYKLGSNIWSILVAVSAGFAVAAIAGFCVYFPIRSAKRQEHDAFVPFRENVSASQYVQPYPVHLLCDAPIRADNRQERDAFIPFRENVSAAQYMQPYQVHLPSDNMSNKTNLVCKSFSQKPNQYDDPEWAVASNFVNKEYEQKLSDYKKNLRDVFVSMVSSGWEFRFDEPGSRQNSHSQAYAKNVFTPHLFDHNIATLKSVVNKSLGNVVDEVYQSEVVHNFSGILNNLVSSVNWGFGVRRTIASSNRLSGCDSQCQNIINDFVGIMPMKEGQRPSFLREVVEKNDIGGRSQFNVEISQERSNNTSARLLHPLSDDEQFGPKFNEVIDFFAHLLIFYDKMHCIELDASALQNVILNKGRDGKKVSSIMTHSSAQPVYYTSCPVVPSAPPQ